MDEPIHEGLRSALESLLVQQQLRAAPELPGDSYWYHRPQRNFRPDIGCDLFVASNGPVASIACKKCRQYTLHMSTGKGKPWLCEHCDGDRLAKHLAAFETLRAAASSTAG